MTDSNYTHILAVVDRSGSMGWKGVDREMEGALNGYFRGQSEVDGKCLVDYVQFDNTSELLYHDVEVGRAEATINPRGGTALIDAIAKSTLDLVKKLERLPEALRPGRVQVVIVTDGQENSSTKYSSEDVKHLIKKQTEIYDWDFVFLGANIDAVNTAATFGIDRNKALDFNIYSGEAILNTSSVLNNYTTSYRGGGTQNANFSKGDRESTMVGKKKK